MKKVFKSLLSRLALIVVIGICISAYKVYQRGITAQNTAQLIKADRTQSNFWKTERMKLYDSVEFNNSVVTAVGERDEDSRAISKEIIEVLLAELKDERGVHVETALTALGAVTGFSAQMGIREGLVKSGKISEQNAFVVVTTKDGGTYYFGDLLNQNITEPKNGNDSVFGIVSARAQKLGAKNITDIKAIFRRSADVLGSDKFAVPDVSAEHLPHMTAQFLLWKYWNPIRQILVLHSKDPLKWPLYLAQTSADMMEMGKDALDPAISSQLIMDAVIPMSKIDPRTVHMAYFKQY